MYVAVPGPIIGLCPATGAGADHHIRCRAQIHAWKNAAAAFAFTKAADSFHVHAPRKASAQLETAFPAVLRAISPVQLRFINAAEKADNASV